MLQNVLDGTHRLSVTLQSSVLDLVHGSKEARKWVYILESEINDEAVLDALFKKAGGIASKHEIHERLEGNSIAPMLRPKKPSQYWKQSLYVPFFDHLTSELAEKLVDSVCHTHKITRKLLQFQI